ncbi:hypothetical protein HDU96_009071 [Phlyctochytrium bullatum]|nr:hypothetical protein HDU96_009071 [Phlyctochytrium bullatum]
MSESTRDPTTTTTSSASMVQPPPPPPASAHSPRSSPSSPSLNLTAFLLPPSTTASKPLPPLPSSTPLGPPPPPPAPAHVIDDPPPGDEFSSSLPPAAQQQPSTAPPRGSPAQSDHRHAPAEVPVFRSVLTGALHEGLPFFSVRDVGWPEPSTPAPAPRPVRVPVSSSPVRRKMDPVFVAHLAELAGSDAEAAAGNGEGGEEGAGEEMEEVVEEVPASGAVSSVGGGSQRKKRKQRMERGERVVPRVGRGERLKFAGLDCHTRLLPCPVCFLPLAPDTVCALCGIKPFQPLPSSASSSQVHVIPSSVSLPESSLSQFGGVPMGPRDRLLTGVEAVLAVMAARRGPVWVVGWIWEEEVRGVGEGVRKRVAEMGAECVGLMRKLRNLNSKKQQAKRLRGLTEAPKHPTGVPAGKIRKLAVAIAKGLNGPKQSAPEKNVPAPSTHNEKHAAAPPRPPASKPDAPTTAKALGSASAKGASVAAPRRAVVPPSQGPRTQPPAPDTQPPAAIPTPRPATLVRTASEPARLAPPPLPPAPPTTPHHQRGSLFWSTQASSRSASTPATRFARTLTDDEALRGAEAMLAAIGEEEGEEGEEERLVVNRPRRETGGVAGGNAGGAAAVAKEKGKERTDGAAAAAAGARERGKEQAVAAIVAKAGGGKGVQSGAASGGKKRGGSVAFEEEGGGEKGTGKGGNPSKKRKKNNGVAATASTAAPSQKPATSGLAKGKPEPPPAAASTKRPNPKSGKPPAQPLEPILLADPFDDVPAATETPVVTRVDEVDGWTRLDLAAYEELVWDQKQLVKEMVGVCEGGWGVVGIGAWRMEGLLGDVKGWEGRARKRRKVGEGWKLAFRPHCYAMVTNVASHNLMLSLGFEETLERTYEWLAIKRRPLPIPSILESTHQTAKMDGRQSMLERIDSKSIATDVPVALDTPKPVTNNPTPHVIALPRPTDAPLLVLDTVLGLLAAAHSRSITDGNMVLAAHLLVDRFVARANPTLPLGCEVHLFVEADADAEAPLDTLVMRAVGFGVLGAGQRVGVWFRPDGAGASVTREAKAGCLRKLFGASVRRPERLVGRSTEDVDNWCEAPENGDPRFAFLSAVDRDLKQLMVEEGIVRVVWDYRLEVLHWLPKGVGLEEAAAEVGAVVEAGGERYVVDLIRPDDIEELVANATVGYTRPYLHQLATHPALQPQSRVLRPLTSSTPASWCVTHVNYGVGLVGTHATHQRRGLAVRCVSGLCVAQRRWFGEQVTEREREVMRRVRKGWGWEEEETKEEEEEEEEEEGVWVPHAFIKTTNEASLATFRRMGFVREDERRFDWAGVMVVV